MTSPFSHRPIIMSEVGLVVSGHHKASEAGAAVLRSGGLAIDAAVAASAALCCAVPHMNGLGGDCIALYYEANTRRVHTINGSGSAPLRIASDALVRTEAIDAPLRGALTISVPGLVDAWTTSLARFGTRPLADLLRPAEALARDGVPLDNVLQAFLAGDVYAKLASDFPALADLYGAPGRRDLGTRIRNPVLAQTLAELAEGGAEVFYRGDVGRRLVADLQQAGAALEEDDLARHRTRLDPSLQVGFLGRRLHTAPPNSQGVALAGLALLADRRAAARGRAEPLAPQTYLPDRARAFALRDKIADDPVALPWPEGLLDSSALPGLLAEDRGSAKPNPAGDTSTLVVVDRHGNAVSWVQSLFEEFGSGIVSPSTGLVLHNRLGLQTARDGGPFSLRPGLRPFHTLCPALVEGADGCEVAIATPGDHAQPQTIHQVLTRLYAEGMDVQASIEAPRIRHDGGAVMVEDRVPASWRAEIVAMSYAVTEIGPWSRKVGGVNAIRRMPCGLLMGGADPRRASYAVAAD